LSRYSARLGLGHDHEVVRDVISAMAAVSTAADYLDAASGRQAALRLAVAVCRRAARTCRSFGLEHDLPLCAAACERAAAEVERALEQPAA
jgi:hypothetical protein